MASSNADLFSVKGMVALVTGGGTGIGLMISRALANAGAEKVYIVGRRAEVLEAAVKSIGAAPGVVVPLTGDVTDQAQLKALAERVEKEVGYLNLLFCNSGISGPQVPAPDYDFSPNSTPPSLADFAAANLAIPPDAYAQTFHVNITAVWYTTMTFLPLLDRGNKEGNLDWTSQVVVTSSIAGFNRKAPGGWAYGQSKAAATHAVKQLAVLLPTWGIRANAIAPGLFPSEMSAPIIRNMGGDPSSSGVIPVDRTRVPLGRMGDEKEMAGTVLYMVSKAGAYCNGNVIVVDGGRLGTMSCTY